MCTTRLVTRMSSVKPFKVVQHVSFRYSVSGIYSNHIRTHQIHMLVHVDSLLGLTSGLPIEFNQLKDVDSFCFPSKVEGWTSGGFSSMILDGVV